MPHFILNKLQTKSIRLKKEPPNRRIIHLDRSKSFGIILSDGIQPALSNMMSATQYAVKGGGGI
jgi:hypothetical protein